MKELTFVDIEPNISDEERKRNIEAFVNTLYRVTGNPIYAGCNYDIETETLTLYHKRRG